MLPARIRLRPDQIEIVSINPGQKAGPQRPAPLRTSAAFEVELEPGQSVSIESADDVRVRLVVLIERKTEAVLAGESADEARDLSWTYEAKPPMARRLLTKLRILREPE